MSAYSLVKEACRGERFGNTVFGSQSTTSSGELHRDRRDVVNQLGVAGVANIARQQGPRGEVQLCENPSRNIVLSEPTLKKSLGRMDRLEERIEALEEIAQISLRKEVESFIKSKGDDAVYFREFEKQLYSKFFGELMGIKVACSTFVEPIGRTSEGVIRAFSDTIGRTFQGGTLVATCIAIIPREILKRRMEKMLNKLNRNFSNEEGINHVVRFTVFFSLQLLQEQIVLLDEPTNDGFSVNEKAIEALVSHISSRLITFMLSRDDFLCDSTLYPSFEDSRKSEVDPCRIAKTLALSLVWFCPSTYFKIEYEKEIPLKEIVVTLPTSRKMGKLEKVSQVKDLGFQGKFKIKNFKANQVTLTANGCFQKSPWKVICESSEYYYVRKESDKYPPLCLSNDDVSYLYKKELLRETKFLQHETEQSLRRTTFSHREWKYRNDMV